MFSPSSFNLKSLKVSLFIAAAFVILYPLLINYIYVDYIPESEVNSRAAWLLVIAGFSYIFAFKKLYAPVLIVFFITGFIDVMYATMFGGIITTSAIEAMMLTDAKEVIEFIPSYLDIHSITMGIIYVAVSVFLIVRARPHKSSHWGYKILFALAILVFIALMHITIIKHKYANSLPGFMSAFPNYLKDAEDVESIIKRRENVILNSKHTASLRTQTPQTYIVVIGESLSRKHMSLYGYSRNTSSELVKIKSELLIFNNVISSSAQTQPSLSSALTEASSRGREEYNNALSMVDVANLAGYKTWWISNQQPMRAMIASISNMANVQHFISNDFHGVENNRYDGYMLPAIEKSLSDDAPHKVIFVHMLGSHIRYKHRFPKESAYFTNQKTEAYTDDLTEQQLDQINKYDNSVRYNDSVMSDIINLLKNEHKSENNGALINGLVMFSDHGEDVYDTRNFRGHAPDDRATKTMLEIPYIFWLSDSYQKMFPASYQTAKANTSVPYMLDDGFHTVLDLIGVDFDAYDAKSSIMSDQYEPKERIVYKKDYDKDQ